MSIKSFLDYLKLEKKEGVDLFKVDRTIYREKINDKAEEIGKLSLYVNRVKIFKRIYFGFLLAFLMAVIKTIILGGLIYLSLKRFYNYLI